jgi:hypothetical protein
MAYQEVYHIFSLVDSVVLLGDCTFIYRLAKFTGCMRHVIFFLCIEAEDFKWLQEQSSTGGGTSSIP